MGRFYGLIGFAEQVETSPGVWQEKIVERCYYGDELKNVTSVRSGSNLNDNLTFDNRFSIITDPYAHEKFSLMRYISWDGTLWKITSIEEQRPRLIITIGGVYNEQIKET